MIDRRNLQVFHPFARLNRLLEGIPPGPSPAPDGRPILLSVGEPQHQPPGFVAEELARHAAGWSRYPPARGSADYLRAAGQWLVRRYGLDESALSPGGMLDPETALLALPGTREGLFFAALAAIPPAVPGAEPPVALIPNPFYHVYAGAAVAAGAEPVFVPAPEETGYLPDFEALDPAVLDRAAVCTLCSPANPQGSIADLDRLERLIRLARRHDFVLMLDECYTELYNDAPPPGGLQAAAALGGSLDRLLAFHSLSKRSSSPGLRCGFAAGDPALIAGLEAILRVGGAGVPLPVLAAGARLWRDEAHAAENRAHYRQNFTIAESILGRHPGFHLPAGGFFLWLRVGDGEAAARELWARAGIKVLPGGYMGAQDKTGENPGNPYIRMALVYDSALTESALRRAAEIL